MLLEMEYDCLGDFLPEVSKLSRCSNNSMILCTTRDLNVDRDRVLLAKLRVLFDDEHERFGPIKIFARSQFFLDEQLDDPKISQLANS
jgi:hypothetical protein